MMSAEKNKPRRLPLLRNSGTYSRFRASCSATAATDTAISETVMGQ